MSCRVVSETVLNGENGAIEQDKDIFYGCVKNCSGFTVKRGDVVVVHSAGANRWEFTLPTVSVDISALVRIMMHMDSRILKLEKELAEMRGKQTTAKM